MDWTLFWGFIGIAIVAVAMGMGAVWFGFRMSNESAMRIANAYKDGIQQGESFTLTGAKKLNSENIDAESVLRQQGMKMKLRTAENEVAAEDEISKAIAKYEAQIEESENELRGIETPSLVVDENQSEAMRVKAVQDHALLLQENSRREKAARTKQSRLRESLDQTIASTYRKYGDLPKAMAYERHVCVLSGKIKDPEFDSAIPKKQEVIPMDEDPYFEAMNGHEQPSTPTAGR